MSTFSLIGDMTAAAAITSAEPATFANPAEKLDASRRKLAELQRQEMDMTARYGSIVIEGTAEQVQDMYNARATVRRAISDLGAAIRQLELDAERQYDREQATHAAGLAEAAKQFDTALTALLGTMRRFDIIGRAMYNAANRARDPRATALHRLTHDRGNTVTGVLADVLDGLTQQATPWEITQPSLLALARSQAHISDWED